MQCTQDLLDNFSLEHYTFINQIFGDGSVREIIMEVFNEPHNEGLEFDVETVEGDEMFEHGYHHILVKVGNKTIKDTAYCSVDKKHQLPFKNKRDTLCQTYSIMKYMNKPIDSIFNNKRLNFKDKFALIHKMMVDTYREIISNPGFIREINLLDFKNTKDAEGNPMFRNYTKSNNPALKMDADQILKNVKKVLDKWEAYGYWYFILDGTCEIGEMIPNLIVRTEEIKSNLSKPVQKPPPAIIERRETRQTKRERSQSRSQSQNRSQSRSRSQSQSRNRRRTDDII